MRDAESGRALAGAVVTVERSDVMAVTDAAGSCLILSQVGPGTRLVATFAGYASDTLVIAREARTGAGSMLSFDLYPDKPRLVQGRVADDISRNGLAEATVTVTGTGLHTTAQVDGWYVLAAFPHGPQVLTAEFPGYRPDTERVTVHGGETASVDFGLRETGNTGSVTGQVIAKTTGQPQAGVVIALDSTAVSTVSDSGGHYSFENLPAGVYGLTATCGGFLKGITRFRVVKGWVVEVNLGLLRPGEELTPAAPEQKKRK